MTNWCYFRSNNGVLVTLVLYITLSSEQQFDQVYTGVFFSPYVKHPYNKGESPPAENNYTANETRVMLEVILEKFSNVATWGVGSRNVSYVRNVTYYNNSDVEVYTSEVAARINRHHGNKSITILQGIRHYEGLQMETEMRLAIECAEKANQIFPGTVKGLIFNKIFSIKWYAHAQQTLMYMKELKNSSAAHLKLGIRIGYSLISAYKFNEVDQKEIQVVRDVLQESDFVICVVNPSSESKNDGVEAAFESIGVVLLEFRRQIQKNYTDDELEVMVQIRWPTDGYKWNNLKNMKTYWQVASQWASQHSFPVRFLGAFDTPLITESAHVGWWKLTDNWKSDQRAGYIEKILEFNESSTTDGSSTTTISSAGIAGITLGILGLFFLFSLIAVLLSRVKRLQQQLTKEDIRQFMKGMSEEVAVQQDASNLDTSALRYPYEISFEIPKNQLKIQHDHLLGIGQFGCVFKAVIEYPSGECKNVALKVARDDCPRSALKGLLSEIKILIYIGKHANIVALMGAYTAELKGGIVYIATELCILGSLQGHLRKHQKLTRSTISGTNISVEAEPNETVYIDDLEPISFLQMVQWSQEVACGMEYLGTKNVVHADLATRNVLLTVNKTAKISDFGLSRKMYDYTKCIKSEQEPLPWRWMAIESLKRCEFSVKSDVWSYGVTLWEIFSLGTNPYPGLSGNLAFVNMLEDGLRLECPSYATPELYELMANCWHTEVDERPSFTDIYKILNDVISKDDNITCNSFEAHTRESCVTETCI